MDTHRDGGPSPAQLIAIVLAGAIAVALLPAWILRDWDASPESRAFASTPQFIVWLLILCGQTAIWVGAGAFVVSAITRRWRDLRGRGALTAHRIVALAGTVVVIVLLAVTLLFGMRLGIYEQVRLAGMPDGSSWPLTDHVAKVTPLVAIALALGALAIFGMWLTTAGFSQLARRSADEGAVVLRRFIELRSELTTMLAVAGALVGLATLSSGALREAVVAASAAPAYRERATACLEQRLAARQTPADDARELIRDDFEALIERYEACDEIAFAPEYVLAYGLLFTGVLAIAFAPSFHVMRLAGARLLEDSLPLPSPADPSFVEQLERRQALEAVLQTNVSATATFKAGVAILAPLAASLISTYLPT